MALMPKPPLRYQRNIWRDILATLLFVIAAYTLVELCAPRFTVDGPSMQPTFETGQFLIASRLSYLFGEPERGDITIFTLPGALPGDPPLVKRLIGLPGDLLEIQAAQIYINGTQLSEPYINEICQRASCPDQRWTLAPGEYFLMGDNRNHSRDSRTFGPIPHDQLIGEALIRYWPPHAWAITEKLHYIP